MKNSQQIVLVCMFFMLFGMVNVMARPFLGSPLPVQTFPPSTTAMEICFMRRSR